MTVLERVIHAFKVPKLAAHKHRYAIRARLDGFGIEGQRDFDNASITVFSPEWRQLRSIALTGEGMVLDMLEVSPGTWMDAQKTFGAGQIVFSVTNG